ncbi:hypothetical protein JTE90_004056 [Oedothorax gibbosus]|uniref:Reverse transcriptase domain-containing protein n=1 Tax=Oedothorax gibbosus TaxID=931172 RepID=A0AAV6U5V5_9ARAC|nr:hypothetical protein JTE90_004056 [Oedothorax gibbosus]
MSAPPPEPPELCPPPTPPIASRTRGRTNGFSGPQPMTFAESLEALDATVWKIPRQPATYDDTHPNALSSPSLSPSHCVSEPLAPSQFSRDVYHDHAPSPSDVTPFQLQESQDTLETPLCPPCEVSLLQENEDQATQVTDATLSLSSTPSLAEDKIPSSDPISPPIEDPFRSVPSSPSPKSDHLRLASLPCSPAKKTSHLPKRKSVMGPPPAPFDIKNSTAKKKLSFARLSSSMDEQARIFGTDPPPTIVSQDQVFSSLPSSSPPSHPSFPSSLPQAAPSASQDRSETNPPTRYADTHDPTPGPTPSASPPFDSSNELTADDAVQADELDSPPLTPPPSSDDSDDFPLVDFVDILKEIHENRDDGQAWGVFEQVMGEITDAIGLISGLPPQGDQTTPFTPKHIDASNCRVIQRLYKRNRRRAIRLIVEGDSSRCHIPAADVFDHFKKIFEERDFDRSVLMNAFPTNHPEMDTSPFTPAEIRGRLHKFENSAPGPDRLSYENLKQAYPDCRIIARSFNFCLYSKRIPSAWKKSKSILIHKKNDIDDL